MLEGHPELTECHPELTRKLVEYTKRNFLFLLGISGSQTQCQTKRFRNEFGMTDILLPPVKILTILKIHR